MRGLEHSQSLERAVLVGHVAVPGVGVERVFDGAEPGSDVDTAEDDLTADEAPCCAPVP